MEPQSQLDTSSPSFYFVLALLVGIYLLFMGVCLTTVIVAWIKKTRKWIIIGSIGGTFLFLSVAWMIWGTINGIRTQWKQAKAHTTQTIKGEDLPYSISFPGDWDYKRHQDPYDIEANGSNLCLGIIAEPGYDGNTDGLVSHALQYLNQTATDVSWRPNSTVMIDGRTWTRLTVDCRVKKIPVTFQFCLYGGKEGGIQLISWTTQNLYEQELPLIDAIAQSFRFPTHSH